MNLFSPPKTDPIRGRAIAYNDHPTLAPAVLIDEPDPDELLAHEIGHILFWEGDLDLLGDAYTDYSDVMWRGFRHGTPIVLKPQQILKARKTVEVEHLQ